MGQKVNPIGFRLGINKTWTSRWFCKSGYHLLLREDIKIRLFINSNFKNASISRIIIERAANKCKVIICTNKPGIIIGKKRAGIDDLKNKLQKYSISKVFLNIKETKKTEIDAQFVADNIAQQLSRRIAFRRAMKKAITTAQKFGIKGIRVACSGRLGGAEMSRREWYKEGRVPLHTIRANIDYGFSESKTTYGIIGCKVWLFKGEVIGNNKKS
jgi:small subunit ribosomal protein S3